jgi:hypothetical protein
VHEEVLVALDLRVVPVVVDAVRVEGRRAELEELRARSVLHERRELVALRDVSCVSLLAHRAILLARTTATASPSWFV